MKINTHRNRRYAGLFGVICGGLLITVGAISQRTVAQQPTSQVNPCPRIYYEEPHNNRILVPQGCPANAFTGRLRAQGILRPANPITQQRRLGMGGEAPDRGLITCPGVYYEEPFNTQNIVPPGCPPNVLTEQLLAHGIPPNLAVRARPSVTVIQPPFPEEQQPPSTQIALANGRVNIRLVNDSGAEVIYEIIGDTRARSLPGKSNTMLRNLNAPITMTFFREDGGLIQVTLPDSAEAGMMEVRLNTTTEMQEDKSTVRIQEDGKVFLN
ncbi:hypothetical protein VB620_13335 [Nodularia harveyana UHCC-0300]|uniref:Uncharacterized protein n=1 Tax=Nodularia harveyana UHCC-0300 TaxID=2974287 RepID=A0ABU5UH60_9CYAN|nr:hypothetical protein [Nodularia harveyana]MEA5582321.1 hypothetical protein [Nodularia harveyana UHCC-0300]